VTHGDQEEGGQEGRQEEVGPPGWPGDPILRREEVGGSMAKKKAAKKAPKKKK
jgi:hypothetical protein